MREQAAHDYAKSLLWNLDKRKIAACVSAGIDVSTWAVTHEGWTRVSRHAAGKASAWVEARHVRQRHDNLETKVTATPDNEWKAEVWVRRRDDGD